MDCSRCAAAAIATTRHDERVCPVRPPRQRRGLVGQRWRELGMALDELGRTPSHATRIVDPACTAFRVEHLGLRGLRILDASVPAR
jgi:hypothetical protein